MWVLPLHFHTCQHRQLFATPRFPPPWGAKQNPMIKCKMLCYTQKSISCTESFQTYTNKLHFITANPPCRGYFLNLCAVLFRFLSSLTFFDLLITPFLKIKMRFGISIRLCWQPQPKHSVQCKKNYSLRLVVYNVYTVIIAGISALWYIHHSLT